MSLFDLQDVCIAIGSLATLDLPLVVDIGIYGLKAPYCTLTTINWFLQELSKIPRGSWRDVVRRFTMIRWAILETESIGPMIVDRNYDEATAVRLKRMFIRTWARPRSIGLVKAHHWSTYARPRASHKEKLSTLASITHGRPTPPLAQAAIGPPKRRRRPPPLAVFYVIGLVSITKTRRNLSLPTVKCRFYRETGRSRAPRRQQGNNQRTPYEWFVDLFYCIERFPALILNFRCATGGRDPDPPPLFPTVVSEPRLGSFNTIVAVIVSILEFQIEKKIFGAAAGRRHGLRQPPDATRAHARAMACAWPRDHQLLDARWPCKLKHAGRQWPAATRKKWRDVGRNMARRRAAGCRTLCAAIGRRRAAAVRRRSPADCCDG
ncbi:hypothetical protein F511_09835 [Dorcoceras hygrometricum]|uniref:Uncharacterized protein n=1 Tax=Dorcoceras hygrometricum TaxID=472368 RepID=A0A2Z7C9M4_9LAMI|nr:hypothetical protein F511_09835 [Dorcoceras hygrometricum]